MNKVVHKNSYTIGKCIDIIDYYISGFLLHQLVEQQHVNYLHHLNIFHSHLMINFWTFIFLYFILSEREIESFCVRVIEMWTLMQQFLLRRKYYYRKRENRERDRERKERVRGKKREGDRETNRNWKKRYTYFQMFLLSCIIWALNNIVYNVNYFLDKNTFWISQEKKL